MQQVAGVLIVVLSFASFPAEVSISKVLRQQAAPSGDLVLLNVTGTNSEVGYDSGRSGSGFIGGLNKEAFRVIDGKIAQQIAFFSNEDAPVSVGILVDSSNGMISAQGADISMPSIAAAVSSFIENSNKANEYFVVTFGGSSQLLVDWTNDAQSLVAPIKELKHKSGSALLDACVDGLDKVRRGKYPKHILLLFTSTEDTRSTHRYKEVLNNLKNSDALLYVLVTPYTSEHPFPAEETFGLSKVTGGRTLFYGMQGPRLLARSAELVALEIRNQYLIGFVPKSVINDNQWHSLKVVVSDGGTHFYTRHRVAYRTGGETLKSGP